MYTKIDIVHIYAHTQTGWVREATTTEDEVPKAGVGSIIECQYDYIDANAAAGFEIEANAESCTEFRWYTGKRDLKTAATKEIIGARSSTLTIQVVKETPIFCTVTPCNKLAMGTAVSSENSIDLDEPPTAQAVSVRSSDDYTKIGSSLTCDYTYFDVNRDRQVTATVNWFAGVGKYRYDRMPQVSRLL